MSEAVTIKRKTTETNVEITLGVYGQGDKDVSTGIPFLDHMIDLFAKHGLFDLQLKAKGDLEVDKHHTNEDVALTLGEAFSKALGDRAGIKRFGEATVPMDEALVRCVVDISGRPFLEFNDVDIELGDCKDYSMHYAEQFFRAFVTKAQLTLHVDMLKGGDLHHVLEALFKSFAKALARAVEKEPRSKGIPSTKGRI